ncbi:TetR family transcriptional regulator [Nocardia sp. NPDC004654]|uniref:TetR/AcrR family transcriptional regulator n=1 Tax=Nocardia sp. NPDC004654 TaxID=3154776 RepID=UPI0033A2754B
MSRGSRREYHTGLSRQAITEAAVALTAERGLDGWSMRELTARLDTSLSVIYHHVGDRGRVHAAVIDEIFAEMSLSLDESDWRRWLYDILSAMIDHLVRYPGVAAWLLRNGPQTERLLPTMEAGMRRMVDAGFGDEAAHAYSVAFNTCLGLIALGDQKPAIGDERHGAAAESGMAGLARMLESRPSDGLDQMRDLASAAAIDDDAARETAHREYCRYALERVLDGLEVRLRELTGAAGQLPAR